MITDTLANLPRYRGLHPYLDLVMDELERMDLHSLPDGRHQIMEDIAHVNLSTHALGQGGMWEAHQEYIDLQLVLEGEETLRYIPLDALADCSGYDCDQDIILSRDPQPGSQLTLTAGMFALLYPGEAHQAGIGQGRLRKAVFKIKATAVHPKQQSPLNHQGTQVLRSERLTLRPYVAEDAQAVYDNWCSDPRVAEKLTWNVHPDVGFTKVLLNLWIADYTRPNFYHWGIEMDSQLIGDIAVVSHDEMRVLSCAIGYCLAVDFWGQGIMTEALKTVMRYLFEVVGFNRIVLNHIPDNPASGRVMQKAGLRYEGVLRQAMMHKNGKLMDYVYYAALRDEWLAEQQTDKH